MSVYPYQVVKRASELNAPALITFHMRPDNPRAFGARLDEIVEMFDKFPQRLFSAQLVEHCLRHERGFSFLGS